MRKGKGMLITALLLACVVVVGYFAYIDLKYGEKCFMCGKREKGIEPYPAPFAYRACKKCYQEYSFIKRICPVCKKETTFKRGWGVTDLLKCQECGVMVGLEPAMTRRE